MKSYLLAALLAAGLVACSKEPTPAPAPAPTFTSVISIGGFVFYNLTYAEAVDQYQALGAVIERSLKDTGRGLIHSIGRDHPRPMTPWIERNIFPGACPPSLAQMMQIFEPFGLSVLDVENLRRHYALTLDVWAERFERFWPEIHQLDPVRFDERFRRKWRTYLFSCAEMFRSPNAQTCLFQVTVSKGNLGRRYPMSRTFLYGA